MTHQPTNTKNALILIIDDDQQRCSHLADSLRLAGHRVFTDSNNESGMNSMLSHKPDLIIASAGAKDSLLDGYLLAKTIHAQFETRFVPVIIRPKEFSGTTEDIERDAETDALTYVLSSTSLDLLIARVRTLIEFKRHLDYCTEAAFTDPLTGLANRRRFEQQLEVEITRTQRYARPFCLIMIDLDHFKRVNDTFGHEAGDQTLKIISGVLAESARANDIVARIGGEEFALILPETEIDKAFQVASRLREAVASTEIPNIGLMTVSIGIAEFPLCATADNLYAVADNALYQAKRAGRNRVMCAETRQLLTERHLRIVA